MARCIQWQLVADGVKIIFIGICGGRLLFLWKHENFAVGAHVLVTTQNVVISRCCFAEDGYEMYQVLLCTCRAIVLLIKAFVLPRSRCGCRRGFLKARLHRRFLLPQLNAIFVALKLQLQNRTSKRLRDFGAI